MTRPARRPEQPGPVSGGATCVGRTTDPFVRPREPWALESAPDRSSCLRRARDIHYARPPGGFRAATRGGHDANRRRRRLRYSAPNRPGERLRGVRSERTPRRPGWSAARTAPAVGAQASPEAAHLADRYLPLCLAGPRYAFAQLGQSLDGFIATRTGDADYVTGEEDRCHLHRLRALADAVVVGAGTAVADDPQLTVRACAGANPVRVVLDPRGRVPLHGAGCSPTGQRRRCGWWARRRRTGRARPGRRRGPDACRTATRSPRGACWTRSRGAAWAGCWSRAAASPCRAFSTSGRCTGCTSPWRRSCSATASPGCASPARR